MTCVHSSGAPRHTPECRNSQGGGRSDPLAFFFSSRRRHTRYIGDWSSDVCSSDLDVAEQRALGDLELEPACVEAGLLEDARDDLREVRTAELKRRYVDGEHQSGPRLSLDAG